MNRLVLIALFLMLFSFCCKKKLDAPVVIPIDPNKAPYAWDKFSMGADLSYVNEIEAYGGQYSDSSKMSNPFSIMKKYGCNTVRVRLWHSPEWKRAVADGKRYSDLEDVIKTIRRAKAVGMAVNLDLHYSDDWADPQTQSTPTAWKNLSMPLLKDSVYRYTTEVLAILAKENLTPEMIQIGNETNQGMLHPLGKATNNNFAAFGELLNSGIKAVRDFSKTAKIKPQIIIHVAQLQNVDWWMKAVSSSGAVTDYDIIGISHYAKWGTINTMAGIGSVIQSIKNTYNKKVMIVEVAYPWTDKGADNYNNIISGKSGVDSYGVSPEEQLRYMKDLTQTVISSGGVGVQYWEPAWITSNLRDRWGKGSSWENCTLFDFKGNALPGMEFMRAQYKF